ncbi:hypothetical protein SASPL_143332 [Salvia splendens]|uniref:Adenylate kinase n=1 Tax=Salvia splendens TaxID=180675 RepID=A0A8X8Z9N1_SALSN|nr:hypothetical protein SASPL_143332 [Salvia splendens]
MVAMNRLFRSSSAAFSIRRSLSSAATTEFKPPPRVDPKGRNVQWVFLGCPGVGKGTYASRLSLLLGVPHIATGDSSVKSSIPPALCRSRLISGSRISGQQTTRCVDEARRLAREFEQRRCCVVANLRGLTALSTERVTLAVSESR